jgi:hypothetical protein
VFIILAGQFVRLGYCCVFGFLFKEDGLGVVYFGLCLLLILFGLEVSLLQFGYFDR